MNTFTLPQQSDGLKINARLGASAAAQLHALTRKTGLGISEIVRLSLAHYHETVMQTSKVMPKSKIVAMAGKYGSTGPDSGRLSTDYKRLFGEGIAKKYGLSAKPIDAPLVTAKKKRAA